MMLRRNLNIISSSIYCQICQMILCKNKIVYVILSKNKMQYFKYIEMQYCFFTWLCNFLSIFLDDFHLFKASLFLIVQGLLHFHLNYHISLLEFDLHVLNEILFPMPDFQQVAKFRILDFRLWKNFNNTSQPQPGKCNHKSTQ